MAEHHDVDYVFEDNDASYGAFGWDFQANAGLFLFLKYIKGAVSIKVESRNQDIEIKLNNGNIYAQAKALQDDSSENKNENMKLRDAIISLVKVKCNSNDRLIYISNLGAPISNDRNRFRNKIVKLATVDKIFTDSVNEQIGLIVAKLENENKKSNITVKKKNKNLFLINKLNAFNVGELYVASIYPFDGVEDRYDIIYEETLEFLKYTLDIEPATAITLHKDICKYWQDRLRLNETLKDEPTKESKEITKKDFVWAVVAFDIKNENYNVIYDCVDFAIDSADEKEIEKYIDNDHNIYHERFEFSNKLMKDYACFYNSYRGKNADLEYLKTDSWKKFEFEFLDVENDHKREIVTKIYMYRIIRKRKNYDNIVKKVGI